MKSFKGKRVLVYGMGGSGQEACKLLHTLGACVSVYDDDKKQRNIFCYESEPLAKQFDLVVVSPGIKVIGNSLLSGFKSRKTEVISEIDLGSMFCKGKLIAVTGTNGKTTVCSLLGKIFECAGKKVFVCGNIGLPISSIALKSDKKSFIVCETSNFQLETSKYFSPKIACILNIKPDHIDRHESYEEYKRVKAKIFQNFRHGDKAVINLDDNELININLPKNTSYFSLNEQKNGAFVKNGAIYHNHSRVISLSEIKLKGEKNISNVLACVEIAALCKIKTKAIRSAISSFVAPPHRLEFVAEVKGVKYFDDSKSTNIACCEMAIESLKCANLILMLGGQNKNLDFNSFFAKKPKLKMVITFGETGKQIEMCANEHGYKCASFDKMVDAVNYAKQIAKNGDTVLLSPACASFDEFASYAVRGQIFKEKVLDEG